jgi:hypothetical protein
LKEIYGSILMQILLNPSANVKKCFAVCHNKMPYSKKTVISADGI